MLDPSLHLRSLVGRKLPHDLSTVPHKPLGDFAERVVLNTQLCASFTPSLSWLHCLKLKGSCSGLNLAPK